jgi:hypothetical protein
MSSPTANIWGGLTAVAILAGSWTVFQTQFSNIADQQKIIRDELTRRSTDVDLKFQRLDAELLHHRDIYVEQYQFKQFLTGLDKRISIDEERLHEIESTRPTTGELRGIAESADKQMARILDRLDRLEKPGPH